MGARLTEPNVDKQVAEGTVAGTGEALRLAARAGILAILIVLTVVGVVALPDGNDYALATRRKHARLDALAGPKIVFVGGSNLAFGLESETVERGLGRPVVNMGMNGYLGVRFMLEEVRPSLRRGDVVVLSFEYDSFFKSVDGTAADLLIFVKAQHSHFRFLTREQRIRALRVIPYAAQQKILRWVGAGVEAAQLFALERFRWGSDVANSSHGAAVVRATETAAGFDDQGDLNAHIGLDWPYGREDGLDASTLPVDSDIVPLLAGFCEEMRSRGVTVVMSYTPVINEYYAKHHASLELLHERLQGIEALNIPSPPSAFVFPEDLFFDTVYHLNKHGRELRTARVVSDLSAVNTLLQQPSTALNGSATHD